MATKPGDLQSEDQNADEKSTTKLTDLHVKEASFVKRGANQHARILLWKSADGAQKSSGIAGRFIHAWRRLFKMDEASDVMPAEQPATTAEVIAERSFWDGWWNLRSAFDESCRKILDSDSPDKISLLQRSCEEFVSGIKAILESTAAPAEASKALDLVSHLTGVDPRTAVAKIVKTLDLVEHEANAPARPPAAAQGEAMPVIAKNLAELVALVEEPTARAAITKELDAMKMPPAPTSTPEIQTLTKALETERSARTALEKSLAEMRDESVTTKLRSEVEGYVTPGLSVDEAVGLLKAANPDHATLLRKAFRASTEVEKTARDLRAMRGTVGPMDFPEDSATAKVQKSAEELVKAGKFPTIAQAKAHVYTTQPELKDQERAERMAH